MHRKVAIVLRGPPAAGKSTVARELGKHYKLLNECPIVLDSGWNKGEKRFSSCRYWDLRDMPEVVIIELGWGEPADGCSLGATRNPMEWVSLLESNEREIFFFLLTMSNSLTNRRLAQRGHVPGASEERYKDGGVCSSKKFVERMRGKYPEQEIRSEDESIPDDESIKKVVQRIVATIGRV